jgi:hypothetical protein
MATETATVSQYSVSGDTGQSFLYLPTNNPKLQNVEVRKILPGLSRSYTEKLAKVYDPDPDHTALREQLKKTNVQIQVDHTDSDPKTVTGFRWTPLPMPKDCRRPIRRRLTARQNLHVALMLMLDKISKWFPKKPSPDAYHVPTT